MKRKMKLILWLLTVFLYTNLLGQISPGDLSEAHKNLEGMSNCTQCHILGESVDNQKCLTCHTTINNLIKANKGYHSSSDVKNNDCTDCHGEHFGRDFDLIRFDEDKFDHAKTTFILEGKHSKLKCDECHKGEFIQIDSLKSKERTFIGLVNKCQSCHIDYHKGTLSSNNCVDCHNTDAWRPAPLFSHNKSKFKLKGLHKEVDCEKCHAKEIIEAKEFQKFTGLKFNNCIDCHLDIHNGKFGKKCENCHTVGSFKNVKNLKSFDHSKTNFSLVGKHRPLSCNKCHTKGIRVKLNSQQCIDCHTDFHKGAFTTNNKVEDCSTCHNEFGFSPSLFTIENHMQSRFKLMGSHFAVPCNECHIVKNEWKFKFNNIECEMCHNNVHKTSLSSYAKKIENCETCHSSEKWSKINFDHNQTNFELVGKHAVVKCSNCHFEDKEKNQFIKVSKNCETCHQDKHGEQFNSKGENRCAHCHTPLKWNIDNFDHSQTRFVIDGAHKDVKCIECHKPFEKDGKKITQYKFEDITCKSCHTV